ncbi:MAG: helix-turn-helix transcriptional regulator [Proteobacteria bacterium]|nr:helix-turn-helix transcriptional regulator [Pseudomonadota bacterium]
MIESRQIRAARALLNWSQNDLAEASGIAVSSIKNVENDITVARRDTLADIQNALEKGGVEFTSDGGIKPHRPDVHILTGKDGFRKFFDEVYAEIQNGGTIYISGVNETWVAEALGDYVPFHRNRMVAIKDKISVQCLIPEGNYDFIASDYCEYRWIQKEYYEATHFYVFNAKVAIITFLSESDHGDIHIVVLDIPKLSEFYKKLFQKLWGDSKKPLPKKT